MMKSRDEVLNRLKEITSYVSCIRVIGIINLIESVGLDNQLERSLLPAEERMINTEIELLTGLWIYNVDLEKHWDEKEDYKYLKEIYSLFHSLHLTYKPNGETLVCEQLKEIAFYEGDESYDWQLIEFTKKKYDEPKFRNILKNKFGYDIDFVHSCYYKILHQIEEHIRIWKEESNDKFKSPLDIFTLTKSEYNELFCDEERNIIKRLSLKIGENRGYEIKDIGDRNVLKELPIIESPYGTGFIVVNSLTLAISMNESPFYWISEYNILKSNELGQLRGKLSENIVSDILAKRISTSKIYRDVIIRKTKSANTLTDIDFMITLDDSVIVFQVKSKKLSELSKRGDANTIISDSEKGLFVAYEQGKKCIECLKKQDEYYSLRKLPRIKATNYYNICITTEQYPTISSIECIKSLELVDEEISLICMSVYDLDILFLLFNENEILEYLNSATL